MGLWFSRDAEFDGLFIEVAKRHGVDPALLKGIAAMESGFDPKSLRAEPALPPVRGEVDASIGLMQVTKSVAVNLGWPAGKPFSDLFDPATNIEYGAMVISRYLKDPLFNPRNSGVKGLLEQRKAQSVTGTPSVPNAVAAFNMGFPRSIRSTTASIAKIYDKIASEDGSPGYAANWQAWAKTPPAGWLYANQPYVDRVVSYTGLYRAALNGDTKQVAEIQALLKKKASRLWRSVLWSLQYPWDLWSPSESSSGSSS